MRRAHPGDVDVLITLMTEFYAEGGYTLDLSAAAHAFATILREPALGSVWIIDDAGQSVGYAVLTMRFGMEYGGMMASIDDLFVRRDFRNRGLSSRALRELREHCRDQGIRAITVEVAPDNAAAQRVYRRLGLVEVPGRQLLALPLAPPTHV